MAFQWKRWIDDNITIEWLDFFLDVVHPGNKVGLSMNTAPDHRSGRNSEYAEKRTNEGRLVLGFINGGINSKLQVCDIVANKELKSLIKKAYMKWMAQFLMAERANTPENKSRLSKIKIQVDTITDTVDESTKTLNYGQHTSRYTKTDFRFAG